MAACIHVGSTCVCVLASSTYLCTYVELCLSVCVAHPCVSVVRIVISESVGVCAHVCVCVCKGLWSVC